MKKLIYILGFSTSFFMAACNGTNKTGGATQDSSASHGNSGPADSSMAAGSGAPVGTSTGGTDTTHNGKGVNSPTVDSTHH